jgi:uncharacterized protein (DUF433 family)
MTRRSVIVELRAIAEAGDSHADLLETYDALRTRAIALAQAQEWATSEELADQFPRLRALREIERLDLAFGAEAVPGRAPDRGLTARVIEALTELAGWATGVRLAYESLENEARGDD